MATPTSESIRCRESRRVDADRICDLFTGLSPWKCPPCSSGMPWPDEAPIPSAVVVVWQVPIQFASVMALRFHVEHHHGQWLEPTMKMKRAVVEHAAMHGVEGQEWIPTYPTPVPHIHTDVESWSILRLTQ